MTAKITGYEDDIAKYESAANGEWVYRPDAVGQPIIFRKGSVSDWCSQENYDYVGDWEGLRDDWVVDISEWATVNPHFIEDLLVWLNTRYPASNGGVV